MKSGRLFDDLTVKFFLEKEIPYDSFNEGTIYTVINIGLFPLIDFPKYAVDLQELFRSCKESGEYFILLLDSDGVREQRGIEVTHIDSYIQWHIYKPLPERILNFKKENYIEEIKKSTSAFNKIYQQYKSKLKKGEIEIVPYHYYIEDNYEFLDKGKGVTAKTSR
jgi:hypothetical protein